MFAKEEEEESTPTVLSRKSEVVLKNQPDMKFLLFFFGGAVVALVPNVPLTTTTKHSLVARRSSAAEDAADADLVPEPPAAKKEPMVVPPSPKEELMAVVSTSLPVSSASKSTRAAVLELLSKLEPSNPTDSPATSPLLNGRWTVVYTGYAPGPFNSPTRPIALALYAGGYTPGLAGLAIAETLPDSLVSVGDFTVTISRDQPRVEASTTLSLAGAGARDIKIQALLSAETGMRLKETYESFQVSGFVDKKQDFPKPLKYERTVFVTYLDDELLVARDDSGVPSILLRKALPDWFEGVPSSDEDDLAPGAG